MLLIAISIQPFTLMFAPSIALADNGKIQNEVRIQRMTFNSHADDPILVCGISDTYGLVISLRNYHFVLYDDDSYRITSTTNVQFIDSGGKIAASSPQTQVVATTNINQFNVVINCANDSGSKQKQDLNYHLGFTINQDGTVGEMHLVYRT